MQFPQAAILLLLLILFSVIIAVYLLISHIGLIKKQPIVYSYRVGQDYKKADIALKHKENAYVFDEFETKLLSELTENSKVHELSVEKVNQILKLYKLTKENQRQRRHLVIKELNLKLYLLIGVKESIIRISSEKDRRIKFYKINTSEVEIETIKAIISNHR